MIGLLLPAMLCIAAVVFAALVLLVITLLNPNNQASNFLQKRLRLFSLEGLRTWIPALRLVRTRRKRPAGFMRGCFGQRF